MTVRRGRMIQHVIAPIAALVAVAMGVVVSFVWFSARNQDQVALEQSVDSVRSALMRQAAQIGRVAKDYAWWNDAVRHLTLEFDAEWADLSIAFYVFENHGYEMSFVVDGADRTTYASSEDSRIAADAFDMLRHGLDQLIAAARAAPVDKPEPAFGVLRSSAGDVLLVGLSTITPEESADFQLPDGPRSVLIYTKRIDDGLLEALAASLPLDGLRLQPAAEVPTGAEAVLPLVAPDGSELGILSWHPHQPGSEFLRTVTPALAIAIVVIGAFTYAVLRHARETTDAVEASEARFRDVADASSDWIWEVDAAHRITFISERYALVTGKPPEASIGMPLADLFHPGEAPERWRQYLEDLQHWRSFRDVVSLCEDTNGINRTVRLAGKPVLDAAGRPLGYRGTATDITAEIEAGRRAEYLTIYDPLTGLPNRALLSERIQQAIASVSRRREMAALLLLDLDRFKDVNDTLGHPAGDLLLQQVAARLTACVREVDTVARVGGDEFSIVQTGIKDAADAQLLCRRLLETFGIHSTGGVVGVTLALMLGGYLATAIGWRNTMFLAAIPGFCWRFSCSSPCESRPGMARAHRRRKSGTFPLKAVVQHLLSTKSYLFVLLAICFSLLVEFGLNQWLPSFYVRQFGLAMEDVGYSYGLAIASGGIPGSIIGGLVANRLVRTDVRWLAWLPATMYAIALPVGLSMLLAATAQQALVLNALYAFVIFATNGAFWAACFISVPADDAGDDQRHHPDGRRHLRGCGRSRARGTHQRLPGAARGQPFAAVFPRRRRVPGDRGRRLPAHRGAATSARTS